VRIPSVPGINREGQERVEGGQSTIDLGLAEFSDGDRARLPVAANAGPTRGRQPWRRLAPGASGSPESDS